MIHTHAKLKTLEQIKIDFSTFLKTLQSLQKNAQSVPVSRQFDQFNLFDSNEQAIPKQGEDLIEHSLDALLSEYFDNLEKLSKAYQAEKNKINKEVIPDLRSYRIKSWNTQMTPKSYAFTQSAKPTAPATSSWNDFKPQYAAITEAIDKIFNKAVAVLYALHPNYFNKINDLEIELRIPRPAHTFARCLTS